MCTEIHNSFVVIICSEIPHFHVFWLASIGSKTDFQFVLQMYLKKIHESINSGKPFCFQSILKSVFSWYRLNQLLKQNNQSLFPPLRLA